MAKRHIKLFRYYKEWINTYKKFEVQDATFNRYQNTCRYITENYSDLYLDDMTRQKLQLIMNKYGETHEIETCRAFLHSIQASLRDAVYEGWLKKDPTYKVIATSQIEHKVTRKKYLEEDQVEKLEKVMQKDHSVTSIMCDFDLRTGLRFAEVLGLTPADVDLKDKTIYVKQTWDYKKGANADFKSTKNKYSVRMVSIDDHAVEDLQHVMLGVQQNEPIFVKALTLEVQNKHLDRFRKPYHKYIPIYNATIDLRLTEWCKEAGIPRVTFHNLRHTHASLLIANGVSIQTVAKRLGHANTITTQKVYIHLLDKLRAKDNQRIAEVMNGVGN